MPLSESSILLTGVSGQVGSDLLPLLRPLGKVVAPLRSELDLGDAHAVGRFVRELKPRWIINPGAYTAVDKAETEPDLAFTVNAETPQALGDAAAELDIPVIHFSTDYVFDGTGTKPWTESDPTGPLGVYGASKLAGEQALVASGAAHLVFRTSWVYSSHGKNFLLTILKLAQQKEELRIVGDQFGAPTWSQDLARLVVHVMKRISDESQATGSSPASALRPVQGIYHAAGAGETTWYGFAREFLNCAAAQVSNAKLARLVPITTADYPTPARRPTNSRLDCTRLQEVFGFQMPAWQQSAAAVVEEHFDKLKL